MKYKRNHFYFEFPSKEYQPKSILLTPNSEPDNFYFLESGFVRNFITSTDGNELSINIFSNNTLLPLFSFLDQLSPSCFFYESLTTVSLIAIPKDKMFKYLNENSAAREEFTNSCIYNINLLLSKTKLLIYKDTNYRIISSLVALAENLGELEGSIDFDINLSHELIASFAGTTRETTTRKLNELKAKGFIYNKYNNLQILDLNNLRSLLTDAI